MKIYLIRHAAAANAGSRIDEHRPLTVAGRGDARAIGNVLGREGVRFDILWTSPLVRAVQTAELIAERVGFDGVVDCVPGLAPEISPQVVIRAIAGVNAGAIALVGHEPTISSLGALLASRPTFPPLRPAQVSLIEDGQPVWTLRPDTLRVERLLVA